MVGIFYLLQSLKKTIVIFKNTINKILKCLVALDQNNMYIFNLTK